jgi:hypothetical protein
MDINTRLGVGRLVDGHTLMHLFVLGCIFGSTYIRGAGNVSCCMLHCFGHQD